MYSENNIQNLKKLNVKNVIFLDFDGCITSKKSGSYLWHSPNDYGPDMEIVDKLKKFCDKTDSAIVVSSNWRKFPKDGYFKFNGKCYTNPYNKIKKHLSNYIVDEIPPARHCTKAECTILWFEDTDFKGNFVIFDDDLREGFQNTTDHNINKHFILCNAEFGITDDDLKNAEKILGII